MLNSKINKTQFVEIIKASQSKKMHKRSKNKTAASVDNTDSRQAIMLFIKMLVTIFLCEAAVMAFLSLLPPGNRLTIFIDPLLLTVLSTPILFLLLVRPIQHSLRQRTRAVEAFREEKNKAQMYLDIAGVILVALDKEGCITLINRKGCDVLGYDENEMLGKNWFKNFVPVDERNRVQTFFEKLMTGKEMSMGHFENLNLTKEGQQRIIAWHNVALRDENGDPLGTLSSGEDITERKKMQEDLRKHRERLEVLVQERTTELTKANKQLQEEINRCEDLEKELLVIIERERQRIGQELHDSLGQQLTGIAFMMEVLGEKLANKLSNEEVSYTEKISTSVNQAMELAHNLAKGFHPIDLGTKGLVFALKELTDSTKQLFNISCTFRCNDAVSVNCISDPINVYRIAQEAITNAAKHGKAKNIKINITSKDDSSILTVENDGLDFPAGETHTEGMGLKIMRYRAELMNSTIDIQRRQNGGTIINCVIPKY